MVHAAERSRASATGVAELEIVDFRLGIAAGSQIARTADLTAFGRVFAEQRRHVVLVAGEGEAALGAALAGVMRGVAVVRLGAGLRNRDWTQPDEVDRIVADRVADTLLAASHHAVANLLEEGAPEGRILDVGATRIDLLRRHEARVRLLAAWREHGFGPSSYVLVHLAHGAGAGRPARTRRLAAALRALAEGRPVLCVRHEDADGTLEELTPELRWADTGSYPVWLSLLAGAGAIVTDSGGVQEEASALGVRCHTLASTTARTVTLTHGTNALLGDDEAAVAAVRPAAPDREPAKVLGWDGDAAERVAEALTVNYALTPACRGTR